jgi:hypothetical protein
MYSLAETAQLPLYPRIWTRITKALLVSKDRRHLFVTSWVEALRNLENNALQFLHKFLRNLLEGGGEGEATPPPPLHTLTSRSRNNLCKDDSALFSMCMINDYNGV